MLTRLIPDSFKIKLGSEDVVLEMNFMYSKFDLVNLLQFVASNPHFSRVSFSCSEIIFDEATYYQQRSQDFNEEPLIPLYGAVCIFEQEGFNGKENQLNPLASLKVINVSKQFVLEQYDRLNQPGILRHGIKYRNNT